MTPDDGHTAACADYGLTRRGLLRRAAVLGAAASGTMMVGDVLTQTVYGASTTGNVLVVLSLRGGADGLSMVVPYAEQAYVDARPSIALTTSELICADATFGLNSAFAPLASLWSNGSMAAVHAVGLPAPNRSHFDAMEQLEEAAPGSSSRVGWLDRMVGGLQGGGQGTSMLSGVAVGDSVLPTLLSGPQPTVAAAAFSNLTLPYAGTPGAYAQADALKRLYRDDSATDPLVAAGRSAFVLAKQAAPVGRSVTAGPANHATYPDNSDLGTALATTAALIRTTSSVRAVAVDFGGWDHHENLKSRMRSQIDELAQSLAGFFTDLGTAASRVTVVTISEFGRRLAQNGAAGADHGYGGCMLVLGAGVRGGRYYSRWPGLGYADTVDGDLAMTTDYRDVLAEILAARFPDVAVSDVFPGLTRSAPLGFVS